MKWWYHLWLGDQINYATTPAWYSALQFELDPVIDKGALVEYPDNGVYWLNQESPTFEADYAALVQRMNYLAKEHSKHYNESSRSIGYSQKWLWVELVVCKCH
ncbi:inovirus-type Gp2 protein [Providencia stuartii]|nr:inovirus-type Gp2 protein [Providencia stuartii]